MMTSSHENTGQDANSGFAPIPTKIKDLAPLVVDGGEEIDEGIRTQVIENLEELGGNLASVHRTAAEAWMSQGEYGRAIPHLEAAVTFAPELIEYRNQLGFVAYLHGDDDKAIDCFQTILETDQRQPEAIFNLGMVLFGKEQFAEAETCFAAFCALDGADGQGWNNRGVCLHNLGRTTEARTCFQKALELDPTDEDARFNIAQLG